MIGNFRVIDAHCHIYPEKIAQRAVAGTDRFYGTVAACSGTDEGLLELQKKDGRFDRFLVHSVATTPMQVKSINRFIGEQVAEHPQMFFGFGAMHPDSEDLRGDVEHLLECGLQGVKIHPDIQAFALDDSRAMKMYEQCENAGIPILIHTGDHRYDYSNPDRLISVLKAFPRLTVIGAHLGGWSVWEEACDKMAGTPNLYVDCSSTFPFWNKDEARKLILRWGFDRVLFGSDYPMWHPTAELDTFLSLNLGEEANRLILGENADRLFSL